jgi:hypothetical protein
MRKTEDKVEEADLSLDGWKEKAITDENKKDVGHFGQVWKESEIFYWVPLGKKFPGLDSVYRNGKVVKFLQVKTGEEGINCSRWIGKAFLYAKLLLKHVGNPADVECEILVAAEPAKIPVLGKRKRNSLKKANHNWPVQYIVAPDVTPPVDGQITLDTAMYKQLMGDFTTFCEDQELSSEVDSSDDDSSGDDTG